MFEIPTGPGKTQSLRTPVYFGYFFTNKDNSGVNRRAMPLKSAPIDAM
ncbi:hypothetical protein QNH14_11285 [Apirhabdus apintestini]|nr:hypothetical protein QNH14_11285 [Enterobacteriaceae bacterium CA-0114]